MICAFAVKYCTMSHIKEKKGAMRGVKLGLKLPSGYQEVMNWCSGVDQRGVRERMERLKTNYKAKMREEESASGITVEEISELDALICEIIERERMAEEARESNANWKKNDADKKTAEEMRKVAMERYGETRKRSEEEDNTDKKVKRRKSGGDAVEFSREKAQMEKELRKEEIAI